MIRQQAPGWVELSREEQRETPIVSVVVQTYQHAGYIKKCLDGILEQETDFPFELLVGEDLSKDGTREICLDYAKTHPQIRLFLHDRSNQIHINGRVTGRFNFLTNMRQSRGRYVCFCEGDDYWNDPTKLQKQHDFLEGNPRYAICYHNVRIADGDGKLKDQWKFSVDRREESQNPDLLMSRIAVPLLATMFRREHLVFPEPMIYEVLNGDTFFLALLAQHGPAKYLPEINDAIAHLHDGGIWSSMSAITRIDNQIGTFEGLLQCMDDTWHDQLTDVILQKHKSKLSTTLKAKKVGHYFGALVDLRKFAKQHGLSFTKIFSKHVLDAVRFCLGLRKGGPDC